MALTTWKQGRNEHGGEARNFLSALRRHFLKMVFEQPLVFREMQSN
jgi:hypothetical protein